MSFGRKGLAPGEVAPQQPQAAFGRAATAQAARPARANDPYGTDLSAEEIAAKREAFLASERAAGTIGGAQPATPLGPNDLSYEQERQIKAYAGGMARGARSSRSWFFGDPQSRSLGIAYVLWFILGQLSIHRFYCGQTETAWSQVTLLFASVVMIFIYPIMGFVAFICWVLWIFADLFLIPGMLRRFKRQHDYNGVFA
ncbi:TM2 domain-containing protein [Erythrobacter sp. THAF29]|uniref:TM2 domain-containing protein n=1 Tax=Erythrobacter sp. THAF29 TaxID=2587851 RepID=UPI001268896C|nr:TM2 domain-containing protein [Erythrobacter sp. THAF29]QFT77305.1 TM2 domain protein [Erythrobacter sp. THAF29]